MLTRLDLPVVEDAVRGFLRGELPPFAALLPDRTVLVDSLSTRRPGPHPRLPRPPPRPAPTPWPPRCAPAAGPPCASPWRSCAGRQCDGTADSLLAVKRRDAAERQARRARRLDGFDVRGDARAYHCWWRLPEGWRADTFAAARHGIAVTPGRRLRRMPRQRPAAVRLALASPPADMLGPALDTLAGIARSAPEDLSVD